jgi:Fic family protein
LRAHLDKSRTRRHSERHTTQAAEAITIRRRHVNKSLVGTATDPILLRIRAEYLEMPGLMLTSAQAQRLWGLDAETCRQFLDLLTSERFLDRRANGTYARFTDSAMAFPPARMASVGSSTRRVALKAG